MISRLKRVGEYQPAPWLMVVAVLSTAPGCSSEGNIPSLMDASQITLPPVVDGRSQLGKRFHGTFALELVNGQPLPFIFIDLPNPLDLKQEALGGDLVVRDDGSFSFTSHFRDTQNGIPREYSSTTQGAYTTTGFDIAFLEAPSGYGFGGNLQGNTLAFVYRGFTLTFARVLGGR